MKNGALASRLGPPVLAVLLMAVGCVNRGQHAPDGSSGIGGAIGVGGHGGSSVDAPTDPTGMGGAGGMPCISDAGTPADASACISTSLMGFEGCLVYDAQLSRNDVQLGFKSFMSTSNAACGSAALRIEASFMPVLDPDASATRTGEVTLVIPGAPIPTLAGKTISFRAMAVPPTTNATTLYLTPIAAGGYGPGSAKVVLTRNEWMMGSHSYVAAETPITGVAGFSVQMSTTANYVGSIYVDEIDVTDTPPDGGADGASADTGDVRPPDVREGGTDAPGDVRDAPAGN